MPDWSPVDLLPGLYLAALFTLLHALLRRWYDPVPPTVRVAFAAVLVILFGPVLFGGKVLLPLDDLRGQAPFLELAPTVPHGNPIQGDLITLVAPSAVAVREAWTAGRWPLWNPRAGAGLPLLADPQSQAVQPLVLAAYPLPYPRAAGVTAALRVLFALVFTFLLLRRQGLRSGSALAGAFAFGLGGFVLLWVGWPLANTAALLPLVLYALVRSAQEGGRRDRLLLGLATAALLLAGHPETIVYALGLAFLFFVDLLRRLPRAKRWAAAREAGIAILLAAGIAAPALLPAARALPRSQRAASLGAPTAGAGPAADRGLAGLVQAVAPNAFGDSRLAVYWGATNSNEDASAFVGTATVLAVLGGVAGMASRRRFPQERLMAAATAASLLVMAYPSLLARLVPAARALGTPRLGLVVGFGLAYLGACGLEHLRLGDLAAGPLGRTVLVVGAAAVLAGLLVWAYLAHPSPGDPARLAVFRYGWLRWQLRFLAAAAILLLALPRRRLMPAAVAATIALELAMIHGSANPPSPRRLAFPANAVTRFLASHLGLDRMAALGTAFPPNLASLYRLADARSYNPITPWDFVQATAPITAGWQGEVPEYGNPGKLGVPLYRRLGVRFLLTAPEAGCPPPTVAAFRDETAWICELSGARPPLFLPAPPPGGSGVRLTAFEPERVSAWVSAPAGAGPEVLASTVFQDGGWRPVVDGSAEPPARALGPFAAALLPGRLADGRAVRRVELVYRPAAHLAGCLGAALALALAVACWCPPPRSD